MENRAAHNFAVTPSPHLSIYAAALRQQSPSDQHMITNIIVHLLSPASVGLPGFKMEGPTILIIPAGMCLILFSIASLLWVYRDAKKRNKRGLLAILFIILTGWPMSFIWWFWLRPPPTKN